MDCRNPRNASGGYCEQIQIPRYEHLLQFKDDQLHVTDHISGRQEILSGEDSKLEYLRGRYGAGGFFSRLLGPQLRLRIHPSKCLVRQLRVPGGGVAQAIRIADLQTRLALPFESSQIFCSHVIGDRRNDHISVTSIIVKREILERQLGVLQKAGCSPDIVDAADATGKAYDLNFLEGDGGKRHRISRLVFPLLGIIAIVLMLASIQIAWGKRTEALAVLDLQIVEAKAKVDSLLKKSAEVSAVAEAVVSLRRKRAVEPAIVEVWDKLSQAVPDTAWLSQMQFAKSKLAITGFAKEAAPLIGILEQDPLFKRVNFASPITFDPGVGAERFIIDMALETDGRAGFQTDAAVQK